MKKLIIALACLLLMGCVTGPIPPPGAPTEYDMTEHEGEDYEGVE